MANSMQTHLFLRHKSEIIQRDKYRCQKVGSTIEIYIERNFYFWLTWNSKLILVHSAKEVTLGQYSSLFTVSNTLPAYGHSSAVCSAPLLLPPASPSPTCLSLTARPPPPNPTPPHPTPDTSIHRRSEARLEFPTCDLIPTPSGWTVSVIVGSSQTR